MSNYLERYGELNADGSYSFSTVRSGLIAVSYPNSRPPIETKRAITKDRMVIRGIGVSTPEGKK
jgi:hypothetical protein